LVIGFWRVLSLIRAEKTARKYLEETHGARKIEITERIDGHVLLDEPLPSSTPYTISGSFVDRNGTTTDFELLVIVDVKTEGLGRVQSEKTFRRSAF
jgi:hypothetical protein